MRLCAEVVSILLVVVGLGFPSAVASPSEAHRIGTERGLSLDEALRQISNYSGVIGTLSVRRDGVIWSEASVRVIKGGTSAMGPP
jgi:hypothetical protein